MCCCFFVANCGQPPSIDRSTVIFDGTLEGQTASYTCLQNTKTEGTTTITCGNNGIWSSTNLYCRRTYEYQLPSSTDFNLGNAKVSIQNALWKHKRHSCPFSQLWTTSKDQASHYIQGIQLWRLDPYLHVSRQHCHRRSDLHHLWNKRTVVKDEPVLST